MSCLFNSFSQLLGVPADTIRQTICDYLAENKPIMDGMSTHEILALEGSSATTYISNMRQSHIWGGAIEIQATCMIWNVCVMVENRRDGGDGLIEFMPLMAAPPLRVLRIYWTGGHYEPIRITAAV